MFGCEAGVKHWAPVSILPSVKLFLSPEVTWFKTATSLQITSSPLPGLRIFDFVKKEF